ncbi:MAG: Panacea domain-containing protein [candidate division WOR-3 bacterium]|nr:Panacea domain-containing protein [candidate division WOR-3 bacterium]MDH5684231.1 Panacea domain-containing protein [candidate division WOR-3 bacterium]
MEKLKNKLYNVILFFLQKGEHPTLGKVKLAKLLFFVDVLAYHSFGSTITGKDYIKLKLGPVPVDYDEELAAMEKEGLIARRLRPTMKRDQEFYLPRRKANLSVFTANEVKILEQVVNIFRSKYTDEIVDLSHKFLPWDVIEMFEIISFELFGMDNEEALRLKIQTKNLSTSEIILNSPELMTAFKKSREDVLKRKVRKHELR